MSDRSSTSDASLRTGDASTVAAAAVELSSITPAMIPTNLVRPDADDQAPSAHEEKSLDVTGDQQKNIGSNEEPPTAPTKSVTLHMPKPITPPLKIDGVEASVSTTEPGESSPHPHKLVRQNTPRLEKHEKKLPRLSTSSDDTEEKETDDVDEDAPTPIMSEQSSPQLGPAATPPLHVPPPVNAVPIMPCIIPTVVGADGIPKAVPMLLIQRSVSEQTHVAPDKKRGVRFVAGSGGSRESQEKASDEMAHDHTNPNDIRNRGIPEDKHWVYRLLDPEDKEVTYKHVNDHPEIWTPELMNDILTYIRPTDLTGMLAKAIAEDGSRMERNVTISFRNLSWTDKHGRQKLQGITGYIRPKMMMCCLGGPDAGITTFLDVVAGRQKGGTVGGELLCDGLPYTKGMSRAMGYVTKEDTNLPTLTVRETLWFAACLRLPKQRPELYDLRVKMVLKFIGMSHTADTIVGNATLRGISGGERRRLSYACEIMGGHACVLADLPTNGLDSASAYSSLATIQRGCMAGRSMVCSLVQPSPELFRLFSHVLVLSKGAQLYFGPATQVELYFGHHGFKRPKGKELPDFLEELSTTPGKFYVGQPPPPVEYLQRCARDPEQEKYMVDIDSLQATAARLSKSAEYQWSLLTDEDEANLNCSRDDFVTKAVLEPSVKGNVHLPSGRPSGTLGGSGGHASFRQDTPPDLTSPPIGGSPISTPPRVKGLGGYASNAGANGLGSSSSTSSPLSGSPPPSAMNGVGGGVKKMKGLKKSHKSFAVPDRDLFEPPFEVMDELVARENLLREQVKRDIQDGVQRDVVKDEALRQHFLQRKWVWLVQCYRRSPIWDKIGQRMFADMLHPRSEPIPFEEHIDPSKKRPRVAQNDFKFHSSIWLQIQLATWRQWLITIRNPAFTKGAVFRNVLIGLLIGSLFYMVGTEYQDARTRFGLFYFAMTFCSMGVVQMIPQLMEQRNVYYSQVASGYFNGVAYYLSFILTSIPFAIVEIFLFLIFIYPMSGLRGNVGSEQFFFTWLVLFILNLTTRAWVLFIASISKNQTIAQSLCPISLVLMQLFCGYLVPLKSIPAGWIWMYYLSPFTYTIKGLLINELYGLDFYCTNDVGALPYPSDPRLGKAPPEGFGGLRTCPLKDGHDVLALYDMDVTEEVQKWYMLLWLVLFFIGFNCLSLLALLKVDHSSGDSSENPNWTSDVRDHSSAYKPTSALIHKYQSHPSSIELPVAPLDAEVVKVTLPKRLVSRQSSLLAPAAYISFNNLCYSVTLPRPKDTPPKEGENAKTIVRPLLTNCFGFATPKNMVALMGPSGAGKSTLLDVLAGKKTGGQITGDILVNGQPRDVSFSHIAGYVEQNDSHDPFQTIREAIEFSAELRLDSSFSAEKRRERVNDVIDALGLGHVQHHLIGSEETGGVSPELRKKTTIAVELVMAPSLLFLDEPTTGLDSAGALAVMHAVSRLAQNISVICTIHQPSTEIVSLFNSILLLKSRGEVAYFGPISSDPIRGVRGLIDFFEDPELFKEYQDAVHPTPYLMDKNKADFALEQIRGMETDLVDGKPRVNPAEKFLLTDEAKEIKRQLDEGLVSADSAQFKKYDSAEATNKWTQFKHLLVRQSSSNCRNKSVWRTRFTSPIVISLLLGTLYFQLGFSQFAIQNRISLMYLQVIFLCFSAAAFLPGVFAFRSVFFRESTSHMYSATPYWIARILADLPFICIEVMIYSIIMYWIAGLTAVDAGGRWGYFILALFGTRLAALGFCEGIARLVPDIAAATGIISILNTIMMLFTGFLIQKNSIPTGWLWMYYVSFFRYPVSFLCANELRDESFYCSDHEVKYVPTSAAPGGSAYQCQGAEDTNCLGVCALTKGSQLLDQFSIGYTHTELSIYLGVIFIFAGGFQIINLLAIRFVNHVKR